MWISGSKSRPPFNSPGAEDNDCKKTLVNDERLVADPVNVATGAQVLEHRLLSVQGALPLHFTLRYNSLLLGPTRLGRGWEESDYGARLERVSDPVGRNVLLHYDAAGRLTRITDAAGQAVHYTYTADDQLESGADHEGRTRFINRYDAHYRIAEQQDGRGGLIRFSYDDSLSGLRRTVLTTRDGQRRVYTTRRDDLQLLRVENALGHTVTRYEYDAQGRRISRANGNVTRYTYDAAGNLPLRDMERRSRSRVVRD